MDFISEIIQALEKPGKSKSGLAKALGRANPAVTGIIQRKREIKAREIPIIRKYLDLEPAVPIVGSVGAASEASFYAEGQAPAETVPAPIQPSEGLVAVEIRGDSLGAGFDRWFAFYDDRREPMTDDLIGKPCIVSLDDGRVLIKVPRQARSRGRYHLYPVAQGEMIPDAKVLWAAEVRLIAPKR